ncbi:MipA/OmpV family protein [Marinomonas mediterranea]|jgi:Outer membrane protein V|uniref:MltA-interacting MipA family protein n=1 Tax=Marinomonas mediterranea (strain ATCC 700492 / JCM 21426 / NBRC 103028 / MMB-1) TaxID=717774 RepID=F2K311_MARM1|nr:MipA/OmpV family protein [Marinomonas mediterranea]ADZ92400.1 MltA-interacting MipA family protein [Marinomonas mediterranea MMB-1]WCN10352.1 hypothetical protein GV055_16210 [Marinomonas mediterranea]WCN18450.1 hypothetical protein GV053_16100 [Marinomonas mediterranea MMB-1]
MQASLNRYLVVGALCTTISAVAQADNGFEATVGVGLALLQSHVKGEGNEAELFPMVELSYADFSLSPDGLGYTYELTPLSALFFSLSTRDASFDSSNTKLSNLNKRDDAGEFGIAWVQTSPSMELTTYLISDISDTHKGYEIGVDLGLPTTFAGGYLTPSIGVSYLSEDLVNYYYGVSQSEVTGSIGSYESDGSFGANVGLEYVYKIYSGWHSYTAVSMEYLGSGISDSSIVDRDTVWSGVIGIVYEF